ncbi:MAG: ferrous iron transport protein B [Phycisphaerales bacterium]|nr:ferrous iron transport protein B [Phycisphaerales bacterium]MCB9856315.1 ferrous iron transport protein B [Phycisphaerales bacterium]MCB9863246.1 ferrous iron transport protein B [Phycisphaerales bacterium]
MSAAPPRTRVRRVAVAGNPNSGKTSIFNKLTGLRAKVANYTGVTVEKREGRLADSDVSLVDLPGTYSLSARSPEEVIARNVLLGLIDDEPRPDAVVIVVDASNLERNLYLATQIIELGLPTIIACNMMDVVRRRGHSIDLDRLAEKLGVPVLATVARTGDGIAELRNAIIATAERPAEQAFTQRTFPLPDVIESAVERIAERLVADDVATCESARGAALLWLMDRTSDVDPAVRSASLLSRLSAESSMIAETAARQVSDAFEDPTRVVIEARYDWIGDVVCYASPTTDCARRTRTDRIDAILTHRLWGMLVFAGVMFSLFLAIFMLADPLMGLIESAQSATADAITHVIPEGPLQSLLADGVVAGVGSVVIFFPQICILFLLLTLLEDSGYIARAAFLMDRLMSRVGLHGRSFIPLLSSYACAIPGILAARTIEHPRDRLTTILVAPLMSCSARLPVYLIIIGAVFGGSVWMQTGVLFGMYAIGTLTAFVIALILKRSLLKGPPPAFIMELPPYHFPQVRTVLRTTWDRSKLFLMGAGTTIFSVCVVIWALSYFPRLDVNTLSPAESAQLDSIPANDNAARDHTMQSLQLRNSAIGHIGRFIEPVIEPLGYDWRMGIGILTSFLAREVFVGTMGITFALGETDETSDALRERLQTAEWPDGRKLVTPLSGLSLMIFYVFACQCISTLAVVRKETGGWKWPAFMFAYMTIIAYVGALAVFQVGRAMGYA